jgi:hypothetical protein
MNTCLPASSAGTPISWCIAGGPTMKTAWTSASPRISPTSVVARSAANIFLLRSARSARLAHAYATSIGAYRKHGQIHPVAKSPQPTNPIRNRSVTRDTRRSERRRDRPS